MREGRQGRGVSSIDGGGLKLESNMEAHYLVDHGSVFGIDRNFKQIMAINSRRLHQTRPNILTLVQRTGTEEGFVFLQRMDGSH